MTLKLIFTLLIQGYSVLGISGDGPEGSEGKPTTRTYNVRFEMPAENDISEAKVREVLENPERYQEKVKDISVLRSAGVMTAEMAKFYFVVAGMNFTKCYYESDSTICNQFIESMKDPVGHIGFAIFMKANHLTVDLAQMKALKGRITPGMAGYLGLAAGMMAQTVFTDIYYHPTVKAYFDTFNIKNEKARNKAKKAAMNAMWKSFTEGSGQYFFDKIPHVAGLLGAAYLSHKTVQLLGKVLNFGGSRVVHFGHNSKKTASVIRFGKNLKNHYKLAKTGIKYVWNGTKMVRINPVVAIGSYVVETAIFLAWAPVVEDFLVGHWDRNFAINKVIDTKKALSKAVIWQKSDKVLEKAAKEFAHAMDEYRGTILHSANLTKMNYLNAIYKTTEDLNRINFYYGWLIDGMDREDESFVQNSYKFHKDNIIHEINETSDMAEAFFCGKSPKNAVFRELESHGFPLPSSYSFDYTPAEGNETHFEVMEKNRPTSTYPTGIVVKPFKVIHYNDLCDSDIKDLDGTPVNLWTTGNYDKVICPVDYDYTNKIAKWKPTKMHRLYCQLDLQHARAFVLRTGMYKGRYVREEIEETSYDVLGEIYEKVESQRDLIVLKYEKKLRTTLLKALIGKEIIVEDDERVYSQGPVQEAYWGARGRFKLGVIPSLEKEIRVYAVMRDQVRIPRISNILNKKILETAYKLKAAKDLKNYTLLPYKKRVRKNHQRALVNATEDWQKVAEMIRSFVIN